MLKWYQQLLTVLVTNHKIMEVVVMRIVEVIANNKNASDDILAEVAKQAVESKDE